LPLANATQEPSSTVPFRQDPDFVDRGDLRTFNRHYVVPLETPVTYTQRHNLSERLAEKIGISHENASVPHAVVIHGLGGTGKSQLALKFAEDHKDFMVAAATTFP